MSPKPTRRVAAILSLVHVYSIFKYPRFRLAISRKLQKSFGVYLSPKCTYGRNFRMKHPVGIVIGSGVCIGNNVTIFQNVTIGGRRMGDGGGDKYPSIDDNTVIFSGAAILGDVKVGKNCIVGANSVVLHDIPDGATVVGAPAKVIRKKEETI